MDASEDEMKIVIERLRTMPRTLTLNIGNYGPFTRDELIEAISNKTDVGELVVKMHMEYLRSFKERLKDETIIWTRNPKPLDGHTTTVNCKPL